MKQLIKYILISIAIWFPLIAEAHPFHISVTNIDIYDSIISISVKAMNDDLRALGWKEDDTIVQKKIITKISSDISITTNNITLPEIFVRNETSGDATWFYYNCSYDSPFESIIIINKIFTDIFIEQQNLLFVTRGDFIHTEKLTFDYYSIQLSCPEQEFIKK